MKKLIVMFMCIMLLAACGGKDVEDMYSIKNDEPAQQETMNVTVETEEIYKEKDLEKIIKDISNFHYDQTKVNGLRITFLHDDKSYANAKIAFNQTGMNATGVKEKKKAEIEIQ
ncbi:hypothetical protein QT711_03410 [Sporosarcina saromensis]|uniref:Uncharacterized protein n=1 Tax=Sporosarcina saromensis TaxID=359365 RepID=A0ABU4G5H1_9BACL|nr:hypothetical protein [Sporosarcina saromensis]MDW0112218.1 hypothetical protein [Sporosarcina saromensis]